MITVQVGMIILWFVVLLLILQISLFRIENKIDSLMEDGIQTTNSMEISEDDVKKIINMLIQKMQEQGVDIRYEEDMTDEE